MPFNSLAFLIFFVLFVFLYYTINENHRRISVALAGSYIFYTYAGVSSILYLIFVTLITYTAVRKLGENKSKKNILIFSIIGIVLLLISSKFLEEIIHLFGNDNVQYVSNSLLFSIGISFYSLQAISLIIEVAGNRYSDNLSFKNIILFLSFFPQSLAGPIHKPQELIPQFSKVIQFNADAIVIGIKTLLFGFFIKLVVADKIGLVISPIFEKWMEADGLSLLMATLLYSLQIYFDFWGYSLIAIGLGRILGYKIKVNFNHPYLAITFKDFWHRWHISLSQWMRDYIYIPLGGRKKGYFNFVTGVIITFQVSGIWHGLTFNFMLWSTTHALLYIIEDIKLRNVSRQKVLQFPHNPFFLVLKRMVFFILISFTWLIFRTEDFNDLFGIINKIVHHTEQWSLSLSYSYYLTGINLFYIVIAVFTFLISHTLFLEKKINFIPAHNHNWQRITDSTFTCFCLISILLFGDIGSQEFLYFKF